MLSNALGQFVFVELNLGEVGDIKPSKSKFSTSSKCLHFEDVEDEIEKERSISDVCLV